MSRSSLLISLSASAITGEQLYAPYGTTRSAIGTLGTAKAFTGQEADALTGLSYYHARWYDPVVGVFVSVDTQEGNAQGVNPYGYVRENPETMTDPTGERPCAGVNNCPPPLPPTDGGGCPGVGKNGASSANCTTTNTNPCDAVAPGMHMTSGGCVYNRGLCADLTVEGCNKLKRDRACNAECQRAKKSLRDLWDHKDANAQDSILLFAMIQGLIGALGYASVSGNALLTIISIALSVIGALPAVMAYINYHWHNSTWAVVLAPWVDIMAATANALNILVGLISFAFTFGVGDLVNAGVKLLVKGLKSIAYTVMSAIGMSGDIAQQTLDQDQDYRYELDNTWDPSTIIAQCKAQGGAVC